MFTVEERDWARDRILELARADKRLIAAAFVGSLADETGQSDRWSDIDLTFALDDGVSMEEVLADWTSTVQKELKAIHLFDLPYQSTVYRVFLLPHALQMDLSFTPRKDFRPYGPKFRLIYGQAGEPKYPETALPRHMFGLAVHHLVRARICLERNKLWQCAYWINETRNQILALACLDKGLPSSYGRGFDSLPLEVLKPLERTQVGSVEPSALIEAIRGLIDGLLQNSGSAGDLVESLRPQLGMIGSYRGVTMVRRCAWSSLSDDPLMLRYHDEEWGVPVHRDRTLFEFLILEGAQAGLSWQTILNKRENYRKAFDRFDAAKVAKYNKSDVKRLLANPGIVRNRLKIGATITNAKRLLEVQREFGSFNKYVWGFVDDKPIKHGFTAPGEIPATTKESDAMSKDLRKRGFSFVGPTICYAFMQAVGMVNDHTRECFRYNRV